MVVCKFYLDGRCRYGNQCRFEHPVNVRQGQGSSYGQQWGGGGGGRGGGGAGGRNPNQWNRRVGFSEPFPQNQNRYAPLVSQHSGPSDKTQVLETIKKDMEEWESSNMWLFSSYSVSKSQKTLPGMDDVSPEELRYYTYEAKREGKIPQYEQNIIQAVNNLKSQRNNLRMPDPQLKTNVIQVYLDNYNGPSVFSNTMSALALLSGSATAVGLGGMGSSMATVTPSMMGAFGGGGDATVSAMQSSFGSFGGAGASTFGSFGSGAAGAGSSAQPSSFGGFGGSGSSTPSTFGGFASAGGSSSFGSFGGSDSTGTGFGGFGNPGSKSPIGASTLGGFSGATTTARGGLFGVQETTAGTGAFGSQTPSSALGGFGSASSPQNSVFGSASTSQSLIGGLPIATPSSNQITASSETHSSKLYTKMSDLTAQEKEQFEARSFTLGKIPTRPPPKELI